MRLPLILLCIACFLAGCASFKAQQTFAPVEPVELAVLPEDIYEKDDVDEPAELLESTAPEQVRYPEEALRRRITGTPEVRVVISDRGEVIRAEIHRSAHPLLDAAAMEAALMGRYRPAMKDGQPVASYDVLPFQFRIGVPRIIAM